MSLETDWKRLPPGGRESLLRIALAGAAGNGGVPVALLRSEGERMAQSLRASELACWLDVLDSLRDSQACMAVLNLPTD